MVFVCINPDVNERRAESKEIATGNKDTILSVKVGKICLLKTCLSPKKTLQETLIFRASFFCLTANIKVLKQGYKYDRNIIYKNCAYYPEIKNYVGVNL